jgi:hypothetical protein
MSAVSADDPRDFQPVGVVIRVAPIVLLIGGARLIIRQPSGGSRTHVTGTQPGAGPVSLSHRTVRPTRAINEEATQGDASWLHVTGRSDPTSEEPLRTHPYKRVLHEALVRRILSGDAKTPPDYRLRAFDNADLAEPLSKLVTEVDTGAGHVTDDDINAAKAAGYSEDQIFELVICAAVGAAKRQYDAGLSALAHVQSTGRGG